MLDYLQAHRRALRTDPDTASALGRAMQSPLAPRASAGPDGTRVGFGWHETTRDGHRMIVHTGGTGGFKSIALLDRATGHGAVILINAALASERVAEAGFALIEALRSD